MNNDSIIFIDLDTHKTFSQLTVLTDEHGAQSEPLSEINTNKSTLIKLR